jgi:hypothetical protein
MAPIYRAQIIMLFASVLAGAVLSTTLSLAISTSIRPYQTPEEILSSSKSLRISNVGGCMVVGRSNLFYSTWISLPVGDDLAAEQEKKLHVPEWLREDLASLQDDRNLFVWTHAAGFPFRSVYRYTVFGAESEQSNFGSPSSRIGPGYWGALLGGALGNLVIWSVGVYVLLLCLLIWRSHARGSIRAPNPTS